LYINSIKQPSQQMDWIKEELFTEKPQSASIKQHPLLIRQMHSIYRRLPLEPCAITGHRAISICQR
jgi:hypothetical protein